MKKRISYEKIEYKTQLENIPTDEGQSIEEMIRKAVTSNEPIENSAPMIYTEKSKGVLPETDIRTDRTDLALDAVDKFQKSQEAKAKGLEQEQKQSDEPTYVTE